MHPEGWERVVDWINDKAATRGCDGSIPAGHGAGARVTQGRQRAGDTLWSVRLLGPEGERPHGLALA